MQRSYDGPALDGTYQHISERPVQSAPADDDEDDQDDADDDLEDGETEAGEVVYATPPEPAGEQTTENVPMPGDRPVDGQSTLDDWRWSA